MKTLRFNDHYGRVGGGKKVSRGLAPATVGFLCAIVAMIYGLTASGTLFSPDGARRFLVTQSLAERGRADIQIDVRAPVGVDGKKYVQSAIGHSLLMLPLYVLGRAISGVFPQEKERVIEAAASSANLWVTLLLVGCLAIFTRSLGFSSKTSVAVASLYAFGTMAWQQTKDSFEHPQVALYFTLLLFCLERFSRSKKPATLVAAGLCLGMALLTRYTSFLGYAACFVFLALTALKLPSPGRARALFMWCMIFGLSTLPFAAFDLWFNAVRFGSPFETGQQQLLGNFLSLKTLFSGLWDLTFRWEYGLFFYNPLLVLSFAEEVRGGGWSWGPRYLVDVLPLGTLFCAPLLESLLEKPFKLSVPRAAILLILFLSIGIQAESVLVNYNRGFTKKTLGIGGHSFRSHGFRESLLYIQSENVLELSENLRKGARPTIKSPEVFSDRSSLDRSLTFGAFHFWWVYALLLGVPKGWVLSTLVLVLFLLIWTSRTLWMRLRSG
jgi:hypothetical protein